MPHSLSAKKRTRQNLRRRQHNRTTKSRIRTAHKRFLDAVDAKDVSTARDRFCVVERLLHRAANNGPIHRNAAARHISRMQKRLAEAEAASA
ncbi:MAG: 30S ribosomal protein S20 [Planctomycetes bacterium]|nr:30S ribosomal protein S20 [Planctomycetota bacterium]